MDDTSLAVRGIYALRDEAIFKARMLLADALSAQRRVDALTGTTAAVALQGIENQLDAWTEAQA